MADPFIPKEALAYIKNKTLQPGFSYRDVWNEEHATMFTVAKAMQIDVLSDIKKAVEAAIENGEPLDSFRKNLAPTLQAKGWWGKREMVDPLTGKTVNARLGSDRRLKTIYDTNLRSAYQEGRWERSQASTSHPYLMYRVGNSQHHRQEHLAWDGLILPKDDPWWNSHYPPNGWGCKCWVMAVSEERKQRLEKSGVAVPPAVDGTPGYTVSVQTKAPPVTYKTFYNERKGTLERVPAGIDPAFNWNVGSRKRLAFNLENVARKTQRETPEQYNRILESLVSGRIYKRHYDDFIEQAIRHGETGKVDKRNAVPAGFLDQKTLKFLKQRGMNFEENSLVFLEEGLVNNVKFKGRHVSQGNQPKETDWYQLTDYLLSANIFFDEKKGGLIYLIKRSERKYVKIAVDLNYQHKTHQGTKLLLPKIDTMYELNLDTEADRGIDEYNRIMELKKIR
jgi:hypothetical protein